jgi:hypothetical protein
MALDATALVSVSELKVKLGGLAGTNKDDALEAAINEASRLVQEYLGRKLCDSSFVTPWERTEFHSFDSYQNELWLADWPIVSITNVYEDVTRTYATPLTTSEYIVDAPMGRLLRVQPGGTAVPWQIGFEAVKVVGVLGYRDSAGLPTAAKPVPSDIKGVVLWSAARLFQEAEQKRFDVQTQTDATGTTTRFSGTPLPEWKARAIANHRARPSTGRRAA